MNLLDCFSSLINGLFFVPEKSRENKVDSKNTFIGGKSSNHDTEFSSIDKLPQNIQIQNEDDEPSSQSKGIQESKGSQELVANRLSTRSFNDKYNFMDLFELCTRITSSVINDDHKKNYLKEYIKTQGIARNYNYKVSDQAIDNNIDFEKRVLSINEKIKLLKENELSYDQYKNAITDIMESFKDQKTFNHYVGLYPKKQSLSSLGGPYTPNGSMSPLQPGSKLVFTSPPARGGRAGG